MRVQIRCDIGTPTQGMGHAVRMHALAKELAVRGAAVIFETTTPALEDCVRPFDVMCHNGGATLTIDAPIYVVDYKNAPETEPAHASVYWRLRDHGIKVVRVDVPFADVNTADLLIAPCAHWPTETVEHLRDTFGKRFLCGWEYVMLAPEVTQHVPLPYAERDRRIVFCAGGSDPSGALEQMYRWVADIHLENAIMHFMVGKQALIPHVGDVACSMPTMMTYFDPSAFHKASLVVTLFGMTAYECIYHGTPALVFGHTEENRDGAWWLDYASKGAVELLWRLSTDTSKEMRQVFCGEVARLWQCLPERQYMHNASAGLIDGAGVERVADAIMALGE